MNVRIKQIGLALCLMMSLIIGHASACMCSHHVEKKVVETTDCHSKHQPVKAETVETTNDGIACDTNCVCSTEQFSPYVIANPVSKKFSATDATANATNLADIEFRVTSAYTASPPRLINDLSYLDTLKSLLPARAPPRL